MIGYDGAQGVFITNDPSTLGPNYRISHEDFAKLWRDIALYEKGPANKLYLVVPAAKP